mmetsp:Transcript_1051/g.3215  ORF Transcript_1051/g.3215 Transcript_1051/m.3215 type:complete len:222 (-) Transcript_1051:166-831(-)
MISSAPRCLSSWCCSGLSLRTTLMVLIPQLLASRITCRPTDDAAAACSSHPPWGTAACSSIPMVVSAPIRTVAASSSFTSSGTPTRSSSLMMMYCCQEALPQSAATTRCPLLRRPVVPGPSSSTFPTPSDPSMKGAVWPQVPAACSTSVGFTGRRYTFTSTSPSPGVGMSASTTDRWLKSSLASVEVTCTTCCLPDGAMLTGDEGVVFRWRLGRGDQERRG